jgi:hypothetical protein
MEGRTEKQGLRTRLRYCAAPRKALTSQKMSLPVRLSLQHMGIWAVSCWRCPRHNHDDLDERLRSREQRDRHMCISCQIDRVANVAFVDQFADIPGNVQDVRPPACFLPGKRRTQDRRLAGPSGVADGANPLFMTPASNRQVEQERATGCCQKTSG